MVEDTKDAEASATNETALPAQVDETIRRHVAYAAVGGLIPIPLLEVVASGTIQLRMIAQLSDHYGLVFSEQAVKASIASLVGSTLPVAGLGYATFSLFRAVPVVGPLLGLATMPALAAALTWAVGRVFAWHFASGGTIEDFNAADKREQFKREFEEGKRRASEFAKGTSAKTSEKAAAAKA
ncbi:MAG: DUF697 domain-containing protein [Tistlia sp.]|uniref:YcjF family protein n=1 Tax=Tistlia sp. TaxID=3057121 RepID=UPI0034A3DA62